MPGLSVYESMKVLIEANTPNELQQLKAQQWRFHATVTPEIVKEFLKLKELKRVMDEAVLAANVHEMELKLRKIEVLQEIGYDGVTKLREFSGHQNPGLELSRVSY